MCIYLIYISVILSKWQNSSWCKTCLSFLSLSLSLKYYIIFSIYFSLFRPAHSHRVNSIRNTVEVDLYSDCTSRKVLISTRYKLGKNLIVAHSRLHRCKARRSRTIINRSTLAPAPVSAVSLHPLHFLSRRGRAGRGRRRWTAATAVASTGGRTAVCNRHRSAVDAQGVGYALENVGEGNSPPGMHLSPVAPARAWSHHVADLPFSSASLPSIAVTVVAPLSFSFPPSSLDLISDNGH